MISELLFYYLGDDKAYFKALSGEFSQKSTLNINFHQIYETDEKKIQSLFLKIHHQKPHVVFIDLSKNSQNYIHLARILARTPSSTLLVGLVDYLSPPDILREGVATGVHLVFIKSVEIFDIIFNTSLLLRLFQGDHGFAKAKLEENWDVGVPIKVGYVEPQGLHFESNIKFNIHEKMRIFHDFNRLRILPSFEFRVRQVTHKNIYYHFKYAYDADFMFQDEYYPLDDELPSSIEKKEEKRKELIEVNKKNLLQWIQKNLLLSDEKKAKVLIIDSSFEIYNNQQRSDKTGYTIRCLPYLVDPIIDLENYCPHVIAYALDEIDTESKNTQESLSAFFSALKKIHLNSFVIIFNTDLSSLETQHRFDYQQVMTTQNKFSVNLLSLMAEILEKKLKKRTENTKKNASLKRVYLSKTNSLSLGEILISIEIKKISEIDVFFQSTIFIPDSTNLHFSSPVNMYVNTQLVSETKGLYEYKGLIHGLSEEEKKNLRKFVNSVFFREHDAKIQAETEEFKLLNEKKLTEIREKEIQKIAQEKLKKE